MTDVTKSPTLAEFLVLALITFLLKIYILWLAMLICLDANEGLVKFFQVIWFVCAFFACHVMSLSWTTQSFSKKLYSLKKAILSLW